MITPDEIFEIMDLADSEETKEMLFTKWLEKETKELDDFLATDINTADGMCAYSTECCLSCDGEPAKTQFQHIESLLKRGEKVLLAWDINNLFRDKVCKAMLLKDKVGCILTTKRFIFSNGKKGFSLPREDFDDVYMTPVGSMNRFKVVIKLKKGNISFTTDEIDASFLLKRFHSHLISDGNRLENLANLPAEAAFASKVYDKYVKLKKVTGIVDD